MWWHNSILGDILFFTKISQGFSGEVGAGLFNLFVLFGAIGEPAPTGLLKIVQDMGRDTALLCPDFCPNPLILHTHTGRKHFRHSNNRQQIENLRRKSINQ